MTFEEKRRVLDYLKRQKAEREERIAEYEDALAAFEAAKARLEKVGDAEAYKAEVAEIDGYIEALDAELNEPRVRCFGECASADPADAEAPAEDGGVVDGEDVTVKA